MCDSVRQKLDHTKVASLYVAAKIDVLKIDLACMNLILFNSSLINFCRCISLILRVLVRILYQALEIVPLAFCNH